MTAAPDPTTGAPTAESEGFDPRGPAGLSVDPGPLAAYAWPQSVRSGDSFGLHLSSPYSRVRVEVARVGRYREVVHTREVTDATVQALPEHFTEEGCGWPVTTEISTEGWRSGYYEIFLTADGEPQPGRAFVVVRPKRGSEGRILLELATNTWNAYNDVYNSRNLYAGVARAVSFCRPMAPGYLFKPAGIGRRVTSEAPGYDPLRTLHRGYKLVHHLSDWCGSAGWPNWEQPFVAWCETQGYELDYCINADLEEPDCLAPYKLMLSVGHDEYWSWPMRDTAEAFVAAGGNIAFLTGNTCYWQVRIEDGGTKMIGYKNAIEDDPVYGTDRQRETTTSWTAKVVDRPENHLTGLSMLHGGYHRIGLRSPRGSGGYTVHRPRHWLFEGTGLEYGDLLGAASTIVGYECDGCEMTMVNGLPVPTGAYGTPEDLEILATAPASPFTHRTAVRPVPEGAMSEAQQRVLRALGDLSPENYARLEYGHSVLGVYTKGGTVVNSGSTEWAHGLDGRSPEVEQVTHNIFKRLG